MPAYKYTLKSGKTLWYANFYYTDWTGHKKHICKRGFETQREAKAYEAEFARKASGKTDILFSSLVDNYLEDMGHRLRETTIQTKKDLFAVVIIFKYLLSDDEFQSFVDQFNTATETLLNKTSILQKSQVLKLMGFPANWLEIRECEKRISKKR